MYYEPIYAPPIAGQPLRFVQVTDSLGLRPAVAVIIADYNGRDRAVLPEAIEVLCGGSCVFAGTLRATAVSHSEGGQVTGEYEDSRALLAKLPAPPAMTMGSGAAVELSPDAVFNRDGDGDALFGSVPPCFAPCCGPFAPWSASDIVRYIEEWSLSRGEAAQRIALDISTDAEAASLLTLYRPLDLDLAGRSVADALSALATPLGIEWAMDFRGAVPVLRALALPGGRVEQFEIDCGAPGSWLVPLDPPDAESARFVTSIAAAPRTVRAYGLVCELEATLITRRRFAGAASAEDCGVLEADLHPDWTGTEQAEYELLALADPSASDRSLESARMRLHHVYRRYSIAPELHLSGFFPELASPVAVQPVRCFSRTTDGRFGEPEVLLQDLQGRWRPPFDAYGSPLGVKWSNGGRTISFSSRVWIGNSADRSVLRVQAIGYSLCLACEPSPVVELDADTVAFTTGPTAGVHAIEPRLAFARARADVFLRIFDPLPHLGSRDDRPSLLALCEGVLRRRAVRTGLAAQLTGLRGDLAPGSLLRAVTFSRGYGAEAAPEIELGSLLRTRTIKGDGVTEVSA